MVRTTDRCGNFRIDSLGNFVEDPGKFGGNPQEHRGQPASTCPCGSQDGHVRLADGKAGLWLSKALHQELQEVGSLGGRQLLHCCYLCLAPTRVSLEIGQGHRAQGNLKLEPLTPAADVPSLSDHGATSEKGSGGGAGVQALQSVEFTDDEGTTCSRGGYSGGGVPPPPPHPRMTITITIYPCD